MKKTLVWIGSVIGVAAVMALAFGAMERHQNPDVVAVNGICNTSVEKDKTAITLRVTTLAQVASESMRNATAQMAQITDYLKTLPVKMQTTRFSSYEKTEWDHETQKSVSQGIETTIAVEVSADNISTIENILEKFAGNSNVYSENLRMYSSPEKLTAAQEKCLGEAVENARVRANALASGDGKKVGKMLSVAYGTNANEMVAPTNLRMAKVAMTESAFDAGGSIVATDTDVSVSVHAVFEIR
ncbi:MAG: SIMPL domain-containing protein [Alphaproteobacteria bacterium]|nr:SIMPL domain-containing protein [Alphaproteobacteria bacterium]